MCLLICGKETQGRVGKARHVSWKEELDRKPQAPGRKGCVCECGAWTSLCVGNEDFPHICVTNM